jgi:hypothetical protein
VAVGLSVAVLRGAGAVLAVCASTCAKKGSEQSAKHNRTTGNGHSTQLIQRQASTAHRSSAREKHLATSTRSIIQTQITNGHHTGEQNKNQTLHILVPYA